MLTFEKMPFRLTKIALTLLFSLFSVASTAELTIGPDYADAPEMTVRDGVPQGTLHEFTMNSTDSKIYPGIAKNQPGTVPYQRRSSWLRTA